MSTNKPLLGSAPNELPVREGAREASGWKRSVHGGSAWAASANGDNLHQPQDGAQETGTLLTARTRMSLREPEDARLTGGTRSLMRRTMGLNVTALAETRKVARPVPPKPHAQVA
jgi:hypothetical protein